MIGALWAAAAGRVVDAGLRYTVDKTTREILFLPLPVDLRRRAKPFVDVTADRFAKGIGAALTLVLIQPWGLGQYLATFRASIARGASGRGCLARSMPSGPTSPVYGCRRSSG